MPHLGEYLKHDGWNDFLAPLHAGKAVGVNAPTWKTFNGGIQAYAFSASTMNEMWVTIHVQHDYAASTVVYPHLHWSTTGTDTGVCRWVIEYSYARGYSADTFPAASTLVLEQAASGQALRHMITESPEGSGLSITNFEPDGILMMRLYRDAAHVNDTLTDESFGLFLDIHYRSDGFLTRERNRPFSRSYA